MPAYAYYPGCSLEHTASPYDKSVRAVFQALDITLREIEDWNCCGATMYMSAKKIVGYSISARNLALAQEMGLEICAPCSSCYTILRKTNQHIAWNPKERSKINTALGAAGMSYTETVNVRHPLDILINDIGLDVIKKKVVRPLTGLKVAPYYGCQIVRPNGYFDDVDDPQTMDQLIQALGAESVNYPPKVRCCGGILITTDERIAVKLCHELLLAAAENGGEIIATACPLCHGNLEGYQGKVNARFQTNFDIPVVYFSHLLGIALGLSPQELGLDKLLIEPHRLMSMREAAV
ncbi:MAG: CoB--CoM heterodisulfide reductase iron-sulfur subunit B family protein [Candidatus Zixiibacteriota bacterium]